MTDSTILGDTPNTAAHQDDPARAANMLHRVANYATNRPRRTSELWRQITGRHDPIPGKTVLITGASSGIGRAAAVQFARAGARVIVVARRGDLLDDLVGQISPADGTAVALAADLSDPQDTARLIDTVVTEHGAPDVLINNAGRSIRRPVIESVDRFHDYQRTMAINYFGPVQLTLGFLPEMRANGYGHIINVSTGGVMLGLLPRFSAYGTSKAALTFFGRTLDAELRHHGIRTTSIYYPLVKTPMMAPTAAYQSRPALSPEVAGEWLLHAVRTRPVEIYPRAARGGRLAQALVPVRLMQAAADRTGVM